VLVTVALAACMVWWRGVEVVAAQAPDDDARLVAPDDLGAALYGRDCVYCHGAEGQGSTRGVPIADGGEASVHYALVSGRMPIQDPDAIPRRGPSPYTEDEIEAIVAHVAGFGDGPALPDVDLDGADVAQGGHLYRLHCGACHSATGIGGALAYERVAPGLLESEPSVVAAAIVAGPGAMPAFGPDGFTDDELASIVAYVERLQAPDDRGGWPIFRGGRADEALVTLALVVPVLLVAVAWLARRPEDQR
jgi:ubiquinol-cytochrome c reductase cytochrome c subunit